MELIMNAMVYDFEIEVEIRKLDNDLQRKIAETAEVFFRKMFEEYSSYCLGGSLLHYGYPILSRKKSINYIMKKYNLSKPEYYGIPIFELEDDQ